MNLYPHYRKWEVLKKIFRCASRAIPPTFHFVAPPLELTTDAVDASCHDSHDNATETNIYDSNEETTAESMST